MSDSPKNLLFADGYVGLELTNFLLSEHRGDLKAVVTKSENEISGLARRENVEVCVAPDDSYLMERFSNVIDLGLLAWWPSIIKPPLLDLPHNGFVNIHPSLLPHNRGKNPNFWAIVEERPFGVTVQKVDSGIDTGEIIAQKEIVYGWCDTGGTLYKKAVAEAVNLFKKVYIKIRKGQFETSIQDEGGSFHVADELEVASEIVLDHNYEARYLLNLLRARTFDDHPSCYFEENGQIYEIRVLIKKKNSAE